MSEQLIGASSAVGSGGVECVIVEWVVAAASRAPAGHTQPLPWTRPDEVGQLAARPRASADNDRGRRAFAGDQPVGLLAAAANSQPT